jgi:hypothetical protein
MRRITILVLVMLLTAAGIVWAANQIPRFVVASGGMGAAGTNHAIRSTLGQSVIGQVSSATHEIRAGFWNQDLTVTGIGAAAAVVPATFQIYQNVPNPFNPSTAIQYDVPAVGGRVSLKVYDTRGRLVRTLVDRVETPGEKQVTWDGRDHASRRARLREQRRPGERLGGGPLLLRRRSARRRHPRARDVPLGDRRCCFSAPC